MSYPIIDLANVRETQDERTRKRMARNMRREMRTARKKSTIDALYNV